MDRPLRWWQPGDMNKRRRWADFGPGTRAAIVVAGIVQFGLLGAALNDIRRREPAQVKGPRWAWALASLVNGVGPVLYFTLGRRRSHQ